MLSQVIPDWEQVEVLHQCPRMILEKILETQDSMDLVLDHAPNVTRGETPLEADIEVTTETPQEAEAGIEDTLIEAAAEKEEATMVLIGLGG